MTPPGASYIGERVIGSMIKRAYRPDRNEALSETGYQIWRRKIWRSLVLAFAPFALVSPASAKSPFAGTLPVGDDVGDQNLSPFYRWDKPITAPAGTVLREEPLPASFVPKQAAAAFRILYVSTDGRWSSGKLPVSGVLYLPQGTVPRGGWPLTAWAHGTLGVADSCAPSWTGAIPRDFNYVSRWLEEGFAVVASDYQGLGGPGPHPYTIWQAEGRSVLDSARAALKMRRGIANHMVITGQSQGSGAALGAARLAASYAPELHVKGAIATALVPAFAGGPQVADPTPPGTSPFYAILRLMSGSLPDGAPPPEQLLSEKGKLLLAAARKQCSLRGVAEGNAITMENAFTVPPQEIDRMLGPVGLTEPFKPKLPLMLGVGLADELIPAKRQLGTVSGFCKAGAKLVFKGYADTRHHETLTRSTDDAIIFARTVLASAPLQSDCSTKSGINSGY